MTTSGLFRASGAVLVLAALAFALSEMLSLSIFADQGGDYDLQEIARSGAFLYFRCPYQATVMNVLEMISSKTVFSCIVVASSP